VAGNEVGISAVGIFQKQVVCFKWVICVDIMFYGNGFGLCIFGNWLMLNFLYIKTTLTFYAVIVV